MRFVGAVVVALALEALVGQQDAIAGEAVRWAADVPMLDCDGVPCIEVQIGKAPAGPAVIDSGDEVSVIDISDADAAGLAPTKNGNRVGRPDIVVAGTVLRGAQVLAYPLAADVAKGVMPHARATIAYPAFRNRVLQLDFVARRVRVSRELAGSAAAPKKTAPLRLATFGAKGPPILVADGFSVNGRPLSTQIDTVYTGGLLVYASSIDKLGLSGAARTAQQQDFPFTDGDVHMKLAPDSAAVAFSGRRLAARAPVYFPLPGVHEPDGFFDGTVGLALMRGRVVTFDFRSMTFAVTG